jgi:predicted Zn-dependent protease
MTMTQLMNKQETIKTEDTKQIDVEKELALAVEDVLVFAKEHLNGGRAEQAEVLYREVLALFPNNPAANHDLGVIEAGTQGPEFALPRFKRAVQFNAQNEQYWVTYFDALVMMEDLDAAKVALECGQQYGLSAETTQVLATEIGLEFITTD